MGVYTLTIHISTTDLVVAVSVLGSVPLACSPPASRGASDPASPCSTGFSGRRAPSPSPWRRAARRAARRPGCCRSPPPRSPRGTARPPTRPTGPAPPRAAAACSTCSGGSCAVSRTRSARSACRTSCIRMVSPLKCATFGIEESQGFTETELIKLRTKLLLATNFFWNSPTSCIFVVLLFTCVFQPQLSSPTNLHFDPFQPIFPARNPPTPTSPAPAEP